MASNSNNDGQAPPPWDGRIAGVSAPTLPDPMSPDGSSPATTSLGTTAPADSSPVAAPGGTAPVTSENAPAESAAFARFRSCRWQQPKEETGTEFCTHREVKPYAGTTGFDADAWCQDCQHFKLRRTPKKRNRDEDYSY